MWLAMGATSFCSSCHLLLALALAWLHAPGWHPAWRARSLSPSEATSNSFQAQALRFHGGSEGVNFLV